MFKELFKNINITLTKLICFSLIVLLICFTSLRHELWTDEGYILISSVDYTFIELFDNYRYSGFFPLHNILVKILYIIFNNQIFSLKIITIFFYFLACLVLINIKEIPISAKFLLLLSYPVLAEYSLINRFYILFAVTIFYITFNYKKNYVIILILFSFINTTGPFGIIISSAYKLVNCNFFFKNLKEKKFISLIYSIFFLLCIYYLFPFDSEYNFKKFRESSALSSPNLDKVKYVLNHIFLSINYIQNILDNDNIWSLYINNYKIEKIFLIISFLQFSLLLYLLFNDDKKSFFFILIVFILFVVAFSIQARGDWRHYFIFGLLVYCLAIKNIFFYKKKNLTKKILKISIIASLIISNFISINFIIKDYYYDFSQGKKIADFIKKEKINCNNITSYPISSSNSWLPYLNENCKPYQFDIDKFARFSHDLSKLQGPYNNEKLFLNPKTQYIIFKCEMNDRNIDPCEKHLNFYKNLKFYNKKNKIILFNKPTLNGYEKFIIFKLHD